MVVAAIYVVTFVFHHRAKNVTSITASFGSPSWNDGRCPLSHRKQLLDAYCAAPHDPGQNESFVKSKTSLSWIRTRLIVDDKHKLIYCTIPKIGSTTWARFLNSAMGHGKLNNAADQETKSLSMYTDEEAEYRLKNYMKIMVARHPLDRLVSAYIDEVYKKKQYEYLRPLIIDRVRHGITHISPDQYKKYFRADRLYGVPDDPILKQHLEHYDDYIRVDEIGNPYRVNFTEFILYVTHHAVGRVTTHWITMEHTCWPCEINYDVILKMETLTEDSEYVIKHMETVAPVSGDTHLPLLNSHRTAANRGSWDPAKITGYIQKRSINQTVKNSVWVVKQLPEYQDVPNDLIEHLLSKVYWNDMLMFGYDFNMEQRLSECSYEYNSQPCC